MKNVRNIMLLSLVALAACAVNTGGRRYKTALKPVEFGMIDFEALIDRPVDCHPVFHQLFCVFRNDLQPQLSDINQPIKYSTLGNVDQNCANALNLNFLIKPFDKAGIHIKADPLTFAIATGGCCPH